MADRRGVGSRHSVLERHHTSSEWAGRKHRRLGARPVPDPGRRWRRQLRSAAVAMGACDGHRHEGRGQIRSRLTTHSWGIVFGGCRDHRTCRGPRPGCLDVRDVPVLHAWDQASLGSLRPTDPADVGSTRGCRPLARLDDSTGFGRGKTGVTCAMPDHQGLPERTPTIGTSVLHGWRLHPDAKLARWIETRKRSSSNSQGDFRTDGLW